MSTTPESPWNQYGPFYSAEYIHDHLEDPALLPAISVTTTDGTTVYPSYQFILDEQTKKIHTSPVLDQIWRELMQPAMERGVIDEWTAMAFAGEKREELGGASVAEVIADGSDDELTDIATTMIFRVLSAMSQ
jgi:hypothetical protein